MVSRLTSGLARRSARTWRRIGHVLAECNYAQRRATALMTAPDRYLTDQGKAPEDYAESGVQDLGRAHA
jgi:hypothetical protein